MTKTMLLTNRRNETINTPYSNPEALAKLNQLGSRAGSFGQDLVIKSRRYGLSSEQFFYVHKIVLQAEQPRQSAERPKHEVGNLGRVIAMFDRAKAHLKNPKIRLMVDGQTIQLSIAGPKSKNAGAINVTDGGAYMNNRWFGKITRDGVFEQAMRFTPPAGLVELLRDFAANPEDVAAAYGKLTGSCCMCHATLTDPRSTAVGFGAICAAHWGLEYPTISEVRNGAPAPARKFRLDPAAGDPMSAFDAEIQAAEIAADQAAEEAKMAADEALNDFNYVGSPLHY